jgi:iron complex transport system substrate-binding protein
MKSLPPRVRLVTVGHDRLSDLLAAMLEIGRVLDSEKAAEELVRSIRQRLRRVALRVRGENRPRVLFIAGRNADELKNMFIIGNNDFLNDLLRAAGGVNAYRGNIAYPSISLETVIHLDPEFIFEISSHYEGIADESIFALWRPLSMVSAVSNRRVRIIRDPSWLRPGPRVAGVAEELSRAIHPQFSEPATREHDRND